MDENESKLKNILGRLSELDAAVQALPDFAVERPEPLETEPLETEPLASGGGFQYLHGDGVYDTDSTFQKGGWITNKRMDNLEWRMEALETSISHCYEKVDTHNNMINDLKTKVDNVLSTFNVLEEDDSIKNKWIGEAGDIRNHPEGPMIRLLPFNSKFKPGWQNQSKNEKNEVNKDPEPEPEVNKDPGQVQAYDDEDDEDDVSE